MAKKRKKTEEGESYEFKMPQFDEKEYLRKEVSESKTLFASFVYAVVISIISFGLTFVDVALAVLVGVIAIFFLGHIFRLIKINTSLLEKKQWGSNIVMYIFTWLVIWVVLTNPPFSDFQGPNIKVDGVFFGTDGNWTKLNDSNSIVWEENLNISINVTVNDNVGVDESTVRIIIKNHENNEVANGPMNNTGKNRFVYVLADPIQDNYKFTIKVKDINGRENSASGSF